MSTELKIVVNNSNKNQFNGFFESVKANILRQAKKELEKNDGAGGRNSIREKLPRSVQIK